MVIKVHVKQEYTCRSPVTRGHKGSFAQPCEPLSQHSFPSEKILLAGRLLATALAMRKEVSFMQGNKRAQGSTDMSYQIRVEGHLDLSWQG